MAAILASGTGAVLSHRSAAALWGLRGAAPPRSEVTIPRSTGSTAALHRHHGRLLPDEATVRQRIPVTGVARTLFDLAACLPRWQLERAIREAEVLRLPQRPSLEELYARHPRRRGARSIRITLEGLSRLPGGKSRSRFEDRFLRFLARHELRLPETNVELRIGGIRYEADCLWRESGLIVELDGHQVHGTRSSFESDRERDRQMQAAGWRVVRVTWRQLRKPETLARDLRHLLYPAKSRIAVPNTQKRDLAEARRT